MRKLLIAVLLLAVAAVPAFAAVQNIKVSGSLDNYYLYRANFNLGSGAAAQGNDRDSIQNVFFSTTKIGVAADLSDNVATTIELINERVWDTDAVHAGAAADYNSKVNLNLAYVTMKEMLYSPLTVIVGRQPLQYGSGLIIGKTGNRQYDSTALNSVARDMIELSGYDAIRAILDYKPLTIDMVYTRLDDATQGATADVDKDVDLYGLNATYELGDKYNSVAEAYLFKKVNKSGAAPTIAGQNEKADTIYTTGARLVTNPMERLNLVGEVAHQSGTKRINPQVNLPRDAWAFEVAANYKIPAGEKLEQYAPVAGYVFNYFSGDTTTGLYDSANDWTGWDPMHEAKNGGKIFNALLSQTNYMMNQVSLAANPMEDLMAKVSFTHLMLNEDYETSGSSMTILSPNGGSTSALVNDSARDLGVEWDLDLTYNYTEDVKICGNIGIFYPGTLWNGAADAPGNTNNNERVPAKQAMVAVKVNF